MDPGEEEMPEIDVPEIEAPDNGEDILEYRETRGPCAGGNNDA